MLEFKEIKDINDYYESKGITPYWTEYLKYKYGLKFKHIKVITERFDYLYNMYPNVTIIKIGDVFSFNMNFYNEYKDINEEEKEFQKPNFYHNIFGQRYEEEKGNGKKGVSKGSFYVDMILINHNIKYIKNRDINLSLCNTITHEFAHLLDEKYKFYQNQLFIDKYNEYINSGSDDLGNYAKENVKEFIAVAFERNFHTEILRAKEVKQMIDKEYQLNNTNS